MTRQRVAVLGGGISGLASAWALRQRLPNATIRLFEARARLGGNIQTFERDGFLVDVGPDSFVRTKPQAEALIRAIGLGDELLAANSRPAHVVYDGKLVVLPPGMALGVPSRLRPMLTTPLLSWGGKARLVGDLLLPRTAGLPPGADDESVASFFTRRLGPELAQRIAGPLLGGIYAGEVEKLSMDGTFPQLVRLQQRHRSLALGMLREGAKRQKTSEAALTLLWRWFRGEAGGHSGPSPFLTLRTGMGRLTERLQQRLEAEGAVLSLGAAVKGVTRASDGSWQVELPGERWSAEAVVVAAPAGEAARLLPISKAFREALAIPYVSTATLFFAFPAGDLAQSLDGVGFIVPPGEGRILACTWISSKWEGRAPAGSVLLRVFLGGARGSRWLEAASDEEVRQLGWEELVRLMGPLPAPLWHHLHRHVRSNPQPEPGHPSRLERIERLRAQELPGVYLVGSAYQGVGISDCIRQANDAAARIGERLMPPAAEVR